MSVNVIQFVQTGAISSFLWLSSLTAHRNAPSKLISTSQWAHTLIHLRLTNLAAICKGNSQLSSVLSTAAASFPHKFISSPFRGDETSPVDYVCPRGPNWNWKCYVPLRCPPNRLALNNQACEAITNQSMSLDESKAWGGQSGCEWLRVCTGGLGQLRVLLERGEAWLTH